MKRIILVACLVIGVFVAIPFVFFPNILPGYHIEQDIRESRFSYDMNLWTYVWHNGEIIYSEHKNVDSLKFGDRPAMRQRAKDFIKKCKE